MSFKKGRKPTPAEAQAGAANLAAWKEKHPEHGNLKHGAHSEHTHQRYSDPATPEGQKMDAVIQGIIRDLGGRENLTAGQFLILDAIRPQLVVLWQISAYVDKRKTIINRKGELIPCLGRSFNTYVESLRRNLESLYSVKRKAGRIPSIKEITKEHGE